MQIIYILWSWINNIHLVEEFLWLINMALDGANLNLQLLQQINII